MTTATDNNTTDNFERGELFSAPIKAGKRIYYFDVKATRGDDYYITVTESRKRQLQDGSFAIDKHKIHLYKEDFEKFAMGLAEAINFVKVNKPEILQQNTTPDFQPFEFKQDIPTEEEFFKGL